jgi:phosphoribosylanthranilate isomerase
MSVWIKICANTSLDDARMAAEAGADALGFVFAASPRRVTREEVAEIVPHLPRTLEKIGVFADAMVGEVAAAVRACGLTGVQLHCDAHSVMAAQLRSQFGPELRIVQVAHFGADAVERNAALDGDASVDAILVDSQTAAAVGGTGVKYDWAKAAETIFRDGAAARRLIAAGGLTPENVAEAIATLRPWGVDVATGVEAAPGRKDPEKVRAFVSNARRTPSW